MAKVSIVIPCYNQGKYIEETVESVLDQTFHDFEIIIVNDGSNDTQTISILTDFKKPKTRIIHTYNQGLASARNNGIRHARGEYILPLDADDRIGKEYLEKAVRILEENPGIGIVYCETEFFGEKQGKWENIEYSFEMELINNIIPCTAFFRRKHWEQVSGYNPNMIYGWEDWDFWLSLLELGVRVYKIPEVLFYYRIKNISMITSMTEEQQYFMRLQLCLNHKNLYRKLVRTATVFYPMICQLFVDTGDGFNEKQSVYRTITASENSLDFDISDYDDIKGLRFDPLNDYVIVCVGDIVVTDTQGFRHNIETYYTNGIRRGSEHVFASKDSQIYVPLPENKSITHFSITLEYTSVGRPAFESALDQIKESLHEKETMLNQILNSRSWRLASPIRSAESILYNVKFALDRIWRSICRRKFRPKFIPVSGIRNTGTDGWESYNNSPQFQIMGWWPKGWVRIVIRASLERSTLMRLYFDRGQGYSDADRVDIRPSSSEKSSIVYRETFFLPQNVIGVRLAPCHMPMRFRIIDLTIQKASKFGSIIGSCWALYCTKGPFIKTALHVLKRAATTMRAEGIRSLWYKARAYGDIRYTYPLWLQHNNITERDEELINKSITALELKPLISIIIPVYNTNEAWLRRCLDSVLAQLYPHWELCVADDASTMPHIRQVLNEYLDKDPHIKVVFRKTNGHISSASNSALELATGEFVALLDHDDELPVHALYMVAAELNRFPEADLIYSDEDKIDIEGRHFDPHFKPDWNQDLLYSYNYICHLGVYRTEIVRNIGGFREGLEGSQDYDLALRFIEQTKPERIRHIPHILYHWRAHGRSTASSSDAKDYASVASRKALVSHLERKGVQVKVVAANCHHSYHRVIYPLPTELPLVSLIIPTRNRHDLLKVFIDGILYKTDYTNIELMIMDNDSDDPATLAYLNELGRYPNAKIIHFAGPFNFSAINNKAVANCSGSIIGFLNNDLEVISPGWLGEMVSHALRPEVGAVGAKLVFPDDRIQHAGVILGVGGVAGHSHKFYPRNDLGYFSRLQLIQNYSAVTAACMLMRREVFAALEGFEEENLSVAFNDVDLCMQIRKAGYLIVWTPYAELYHHESASRGAEDSPEKQARSRREVIFMLGRWKEKLLADPNYNPNLTLDREDFSLAFPSRAHKPWIV